MCWVTRKSKRYIWNKSTHLHRQPIYTDIREWVLQYVHFDSIHWYNLGLRGILRLIVEGGTWSIWGAGQRPHAKYIAAVCIEETRSQLNILILTSWISITCFINCYKYSLAVYKRIWFDKTNTKLLNINELGYRGWNNWCTRRLYIGRNNSILRKTSTSLTLKLLKMTNTVLAALCLLFVFCSRGVCDAFLVPYHRVPEVVTLNY